MSKIIWIAFVSLLMLGWLDNTRGPFFPDILQSLRLSGTQGSVYYALTSLFSFLIGLSGAVLLTRWSALQLLIVGQLGFGISYFAISRSMNFRWLVVSACCFGAFFGVLNIVQNATVQLYSPPHLRRRIFAGLHAMYGVASLIAPLTASLFQSWGWNWREAFALISTAPVVLAFVTFAIRPRDERKKMISVAADIHLTPMPRAALWIAGLSVAFYMFGEMGVSTRLVLLLRTVYGYDPESANNYLALFFALLLTGRMAFTLMDFSRFSNFRVLMTCALASSFLLALGLVHHPVWLALSGITMAPFYPVAMNHLSDLFGPHHAPRALAFGVGLSSLLTVVFHLLAGVATDRFGLHAALWLCPVGLWIVVLFLLLQPKTR